MWQNGVPAFVAFAGVAPPGIIVSTPVSRPRPTTVFVGFGWGGGLGGLGGGGGGWAARPGIGFASAAGGFASSGTLFAYAFGGITANGDPDLVISTPSFLNETEYDSISPEMAVSPSNNFAERAPPVRSFFPETWLWDLAATDENGKLVIDRKIPDSITDWQTTVTCLSKDKGIGVANPQEIRAFQPFFLEYVTPYSVKRGEILHLQVIVHNYVDHALPIRVTLEKAEGISQVGDEASVSQCIESLGSLAHTFKIKASELGDINVTVSAKVDTRFSGKCGEEQKVKGVTHRDVIIKPIRIEPEGYPVEVLQATYVCPKDNSTGPVVRNWEFKLPENLVEGSARGKVMAIGEIMGPALDNLDRLVQIPTGCGEQNMLLFTPNLHVLAYLKALNIQNPKLKAQALKNMKTGYEREQNYRHNDASFSAFGQSDDSGSLWLTAFVVRSFAQSRPHIFVDDKKLQESMDWIISKQMDVSGCFPTVGLVLHKDLLGGLQRDESNIALTAYVLASLLETGLPVKPTVIEQAKSCLKQTPAKTPDVYSMALTANALSLANMTADSNKILDELVEKVKKEDDNLVYWDNEGSTSLELSIEITSYVILTMLRTHNEKYAALTYNAIRWISSHRNENGGFVSTQDTILALEALSKYAASLSNDKTDIAIKIKADGLDQPLAVTDADKMVLKQIPLPKLPTDVEVTTSGAGCVLLQGVLRYNTHAIEDSHAFGLDIHIDTTQYSCTDQKLKVCTWYKLDSENTNMAILEIEMPTGYEPSELTLQSLTYQHKNVKRYEIENNKVIIYFSELSKDRTCVEFQISEKTKVEKRTPAVVKVFDYYNQKLQESSNYKLEESCHAKPVPHNEDGHNHPDHPLTDPIPN